MGGTKTNVAKESNGNLDAIKTAVQLLDNAISGSEMQVDVITMPTVTIQDGGNSITVDGAVTVTGVAPETTLATILARTTEDQDIRRSSNDMTITALNSLASSATVGWQSDRVAITTELDVLIGIKLDMANTPPANDKAVYVYLCPWYYDGTTYYASSIGTATLPTGSQGACTIASAAPNNLKLLGVLAYSTADMVLQDSFLLSNTFGTALPDAWSIVVINFSGAAVAASGNKLMYKKINQQTI